jgi:succinate dehydrogenase / fumarate reductase cytochrome b subunit
MSAIAAGGRLAQPLRFYEASIGKKVVMAVTGAILFGYVVAHLLGNLQIYLGPEQINEYARFLHSKPGLLWGARLVLLASVVLHITASVQLWALKRRARPIAYVKKEDLGASYAARTMLWSGPIIAGFIVFHLLHLTTGSAGLPFRELDPYHNVIYGFRIFWVSAAYIVSMVLLCFHLYHGLWSMLHSLGLDDERRRPGLQRLAAGFAIFIGAGNVSIPLAVLLGLIGGGVR